MSEWFESWFGEEYVALYPHRDEAEAERAVELIFRSLRGRDVERALDLACGPGRHARALTARCNTIGLDLSSVLLDVARNAAPAAHLVRADMRSLPFAENAFDLVANLFTSFGYFARDEEHLAVMCEVARVTKVHGTFVLDFLNADHLVRNLVPFDERRAGGFVVQQRRRITQEGKFVVKEITIPDDGRRFVERVRLFTPAELQQMMRAAGFAVRECFGDYSGSPFSAAAPRAIIMAEKQ